MKLDLTQPWTGSVPIDSVVPNPDQPRKHFDQAALERTAKSCGKRQIQPVNVIRHSDPKRQSVEWMIVDGERRWRGLKGIGARTIKINYDPETTRETLFESSFAANFCREGHTHAETAAAVWRMARGGARSDQDIAEMIGKSDIWVYNYRRLEKLHPELLKRMDSAPDGERKLPMKIALLLAPLQPFSQLGEWDKVKEMAVSEGFHKLRTSGKVRTGTKRSPSDDADYAEGKAAKALQQVEALVKLPLPMLKGLSEENLKSLCRILGKIQVQLDLATERFGDAAKDVAGRAA